VPSDPVPSDLVPSDPVPPESPPPTTAPTRVEAVVPRPLRVAAAWAWRLLLLAVVLYILARIAATLYIVVVPCAASLLLSALLSPLAALLRRRGLSPLTATWCTLLLAFVLVAGVGALVETRIQSEYPALLAQLRHTATQVQSWLAGPPFHLKTVNLGKASGGIVKYISQHQSLVEGTVVTGSRIVAETLAGVVLTFFVTFFLIKDGAKIWTWLIHRMRPANRERIDRAGQSAWTAVEHYMRGTVAVAAIHAVVMGTTLTILRAPLAIPIALFMFFGAFIPLVGALLAGTLAVLVTLAAKGWVDALVVLGVLLVMNQLEGHLLQPQIVGKMVRLHPLAVILVLAVGGVVAGIAGAVVAVPITAALTRAIHELQSDALPLEDDPAHAPRERPPANHPGTAPAPQSRKEST
ncbi:MAG TPA: AI-2E family transporter, partial [Trebonia sp.]|nr:AI-2E family transporter [Trebonia sp.]